MERKRQYRKKKRKTRVGRVERLKEEIHEKEGEVKRLKDSTAALKRLASKVTVSNKKLKRYNSYIASRYPLVHNLRDDFKFYLTNLIAKAL